MDEQARAIIILAAATMIDAKLQNLHGFLTPKDTVDLLVRTLEEMVKQGLAPEDIQRLPRQATGP